MPPRGPFAVIVRRRPDGYYRIMALYQSRPPRTSIARNCAGHTPSRDSALSSVRALFGRMELV